MIKLRHVLIASFIVLFMASTALFAVMQTKPHKSISVYRDDSIWPRDKNMEYIFAGKYSKKTSKKYLNKIYQKYTMNKEPFIFKNGKEIFLNNKFFSDFKRIDATKSTFKEGGKGFEYVKIGRITNLKLLQLDPYKISQFLVESQIINTYWHVSSQINVFAEENLEQAYIIFFDGYHEYYTDKANRDHIRFAIKIDKQSGNVYVAADPDSGR